MTIDLETLESPAGPIVVATRDDKVRAIAFEDGWAELAARVFGDRSETRFENRSGSSTAGRALRRYLDGDLSAIDAIETEASGTEFQKSVWRELRRIPAGSAISYSELATRVGRPKAMRAAGSANGANPIPIVVPCHRVIAANGGLGGYACGLDRKRWLLAHEGARLIG